MDILITGGTGFLGQNLTRALLGRGDRVAIWSRDPARARVLPGTLCTAPGSFPFTPEAVINLAGAPVGPRRWTRRVKDAIRGSRVEGTRRLVAALSGLATRPRVLLSASAVGYYGGTGDAPAAESAGPGEGFLAEVCAAWEREARELSGTRVVLARIGLVLGREGGALPRLAFPFRLFLGGWPGHGRQPVSWIHVDDLVGQICFALATESLHGPCNATAPEPVCMAELCRSLGRVLGRPCWLPLPGPLLKLALGQSAVLLLEGRPCLPERMLEAGFAFKFPRLGPALVDLLGQNGSKPMSSQYSRERS